MSGDVPMDQRCLLQGAAKLDMTPAAPAVAPGQAPRKVVYMPSCVTRMMGPSASDTERGSVHQKLLSLFAKGGYEVIYPEVRPESQPGSEEGLPRLCENFGGRFTGATLACFSTRRARAQAAGSDCLHR